MATLLKAIADQALRPKKKKRKAWVPKGEVVEKRKLLQLLATATDAPTQIKIRERLEALEQRRFVRQQIFLKYPTADFSSQGHPPQRRKFRSKIAYEKAAAHYRDCIDEVLAEQVLSDPTRSLRERLRARDVLEDLEQKRTQQAQNPSGTIGLPVRRRGPGRPSKADKLRELQQQRQADLVEEKPRWYRDDADRAEDERENAAREAFLRHMMTGAPLPSQTKKEEAPPEPPPYVPKPGDCPTHKIPEKECGCLETCPLCFHIRRKCAAPCPAAIRRAQFESEEQRLIEAREQQFSASR
jgi:hypothetical protein